MAFDVASVKPNKSNDAANSIFPMGPGDAYVPSGGLFAAANQPLIAYLRFAYKLGQGDLLGLPAWVYDDRFDIEARAQGNPTKDQMRLMMQSLLADRFKVAVHTGTKQGPIYVLLLSKSNKTGPQLRPDAEPCSAAPRMQSSTPSSISGTQLPPIPCDSIGPFPARAPGRGRLVGRHVTLGRLAAFLKNPYTEVDRPVLDRTGLTGFFDFDIEWSLTTTDSAQPQDSQLQDTGPTFLQALKEQLGLKLEPQTGPVDVLVIDHVEQPSEN